MPTRKASPSLPCTTRRSRGRYQSPIFYGRCNLVDSAIVWEHRPAGFAFPHHEISSITALLHRAYAPLAEKGWNYSAATQHDNITLERLQRGDTVIALIDGIIVATGTVYLTPLRKSRTAVYCQNGGSHFSQFAVEPRLQGKGVGFELLSRLEELAARAGCNFIACDTAEHADDLRAYYSRCGYEFIDRVHWEGKTYGSVILVKSLTRPK